MTSGPVDPEVLAEVVTPRGNDEFWTKGMKAFFIGLGALIAIGLLVFSIAVLRFASVVYDIEEQQRLGRIRGYQNRAVACAMLASQVGIEGLPDSCLEEEVLEFYDPEEAVREGDAQDSRALRLVICEFFPDACCEAPMSRECGG